MLYRKIKSSTGMSPNKLIKEIRMKKAYYLLLEGKYNIAEVAYNVGFNNPR